MPTIEYITGQYNYYVYPANLVLIGRESKSPLIVTLVHELGHFLLCLPVRVVFNLVNEKCFFYRLNLIYDKVWRYGCI